MNKKNRPLGNGRLGDAALDEAELEDLIHSIPQGAAIPLLYRSPRWCDSFEEYQRASMRDLAQLSPFRLWQEEVRATVALAFCDLDNPKHKQMAQWLQWRLMAIRRERRRRQRAKAS